jgi:hypothetical protein
MNNLDPERFRQIEELYHAAPALAPEERAAIPISKEKGTDKFTPFDKDCLRIENGVVTSNDPNPQAKEISRMSCGAQFAAGFTKGHHQGPGLAFSRSSASITARHIRSTRRSTSVRSKPWCSTFPNGMPTGWGKK